MIKCWVLIPGLLRRLRLYRDQNEEDSTVLNYFDELEVHPEHIGEYRLYELAFCSVKSKSTCLCVCVGVETDTTGSQTIDRIKKVIGEPRNYGPTIEEIAEAKRKREKELVGTQNTLQTMHHYLQYSTAIADQYVTLY